MLTKRPADIVTEAFRQATHRAKMEREYDCFKLLDEDGLWMHYYGSMYLDRFAGWIVAKKGDRRFAVGVGFTGDELRESRERLAIMIRERIDGAVATFPQTATEYEEGGVLPCPVYMALPPEMQKGSSR